MAGWNKIAKEVPSPPFALCNIVPGIRVTNTFHSARWPCKTRVCTSFPSYFYLYRQLYPPRQTTIPPTTTLCITRLPPFFSSSWPPSSSLSSLPLLRDILRKREHNGNAPSLSFAALLPFFNTKNKRDWN